VLAKSVTEQRIKDNRTIISLDDEDMKLVKDYSENHPAQRFVYPPFGIDFGFPDKADYHKEKGHIAPGT